MFWSLITGVVFGLGSKYVTGPISEFVASKVALSEKEMAIVTFGTVMIAASLVASIFPGHVNAFWLILGGTVGVFGFQLFDFAKGKLAAAKDSGQDVIEDVQEAVSEVGEDVADTASDAVKAAGDVVDDTSEAVKKTVKKATKS